MIILWNFWINWFIPVFWNFASIKFAGSDIEEITRTVAEREMRGKGNE